MDVFISYAREDRPAAAELAASLEAKGLDVWWDFNLRGGSKYRETITRQLGESHRVIVLWSENSVVSSFVVDEAQEAKDAGKLLPISIDGTKPPLGFRDLHTIEASSLTDSVEEIVAAISDQEVETKTYPRPTSFPRKHARTLFAAAAVVLLVALTAMVSVYFLADDGGNGRADSLAGYVDFSSKELGVNGVFPKSLLSLDDRQRQQQLLVFRDGSGAPVVKVFRAPATGGNDIRAAQAAEVQSLESQGYLVTSIAPQNESNWSNWYVITGLKSGNVFYYRRWRQGDTILSIEFGYPQPQKPVFDSVIENMTKGILFTR